MCATVHASEPVLSVKPAPRAKVSNVSGCNIIRSICRADAEKHERERVLEKEHK